MPAKMQPGVRSNLAARWGTDSVRSAIAEFEGGRKNGGGLHPRGEAHDGCENGDCENKDKKHRRRLHSGKNVLRYRILLLPHLGCGDGARAGIVRIVCRNL